VHHGGLLHSQHSGGQHSHHKLARVYTGYHSKSRKNTLQRYYATVKEGENDSEAYVQREHPQEADPAAGEDAEEE
jgi:hypothetical protein